MTSPNNPHFEHSQPQTPEPAQGQISGIDSEQDIALQTLQSQVFQMQNTRLNLNTDIIGLFETVSAVPTGVPTGPWQQIKFYSNSTTYRLYMYDATNNVWRYATLT